jgi:threonine aldolase
LIAGRDAHIHLYEGGGAAALSGVQAVMVGDTGFFTATDLRNAIAPTDAHFAQTRLVCLENTHNRSGGRIFPMADQLEIAALAKQRGLSLHLDGARIFNAAVASGTKVAELTAPFDTVSFCLSKGLGAPVGSLLCGDTVTVKRAHRFRKMFGGGMRQAGILAAAGLHALAHHVDRMAEDHARAVRLADALAGIDRVSVPHRPETNMVLCAIERAPRVVDALRHEGVLCGAVGPAAIRLVTHLDIDDEAIDRAIAAFARVAAQEV